MCCGGVAPAQTPQGSPASAPQGGLAVKQGTLGKAKVNLLMNEQKQIIKDAVALHYEQPTTGQIYYGPQTKAAYRVGKERLIYVHPEDAPEMLALREAGRATFTLVENAPAQQPAKRKGGLEDRLTGSEPPDPFAGSVTAAEAALGPVEVPDSSPELPVSALNKGLAALLDAQQAEVETEFGLEEEDDEEEGEEEEAPPAAKKPATATRTKARRKKRRTTK